MQELPEAYRKLTKSKLESIGLDSDTAEQLMDWYSDEVIQSSIRIFNHLGLQSENKKLASRSLYDIVGFEDSESSKSLLYAIEIKDDIGDWARELIEQNGLNDTYRIQQKLGKMDIQLGGILDLEYMGTAVYDRYSETAVLITAKAKKLLEERKIDYSRKPITNQPGLCYSTTPDKEIMFVSTPGDDMKRYTKYLLDKTGSPTLTGQESINMCRGG